MRVVVRSQPPIVRNPPITSFRYRDSVLGECGYRSFYLVNDLYGGYSYTCEGGFGSADFVDPEEVISTARTAGAEKVHLAGASWLPLGHQGFGETVSLDEAVKLLTEFKQRRVLR